MFVRGEVFELREAAAVRRADRRPRTGQPLSVCILSMDVYGLQNVGGTAIAYWQLARQLASAAAPPVAGKPAADRPFAVKVLALVSSNTCDKLRPLYTRQNIRLECIDPDQTSEQKWEFANPYLVSGATVLEWLRDPAEGQQKKCDVLHAHEWGGVLAPIIAGRLLPGTWSKQLPDWIAVESHGGHMWSLLTHAPHRPTDLIACEVDYYERASLENADTVISPTKYMLRYFHERGWQPANPVVISHITTKPEKPRPLDPTGALSKPPTRLVFYSRKEDRKGLHVFVRGLDMITNGTSLKQSLAVEIMAPDDSAEIQHRINRWKESWNVHIRSQDSRTAAMDILTTDPARTLAVMTSFVENPAEVLADCENAGIRTLALDMGGIAELLKSGTVIKDMHPNVLGQLMSDIIQGKQKADVPELSITVKEAGQLWVQWHSMVKENGELPRQEDMAELAKKLVPSKPGTALVAKSALAAPKPASAVPAAAEAKEADEADDEGEGKAAEPPRPRRLFKRQALHKAPTLVSQRGSSQPGLLSEEERIRIRTISFTDSNPNALSLHETLCLNPSETANAFLLLPDGFNLIDDKKALQTLASVLYANQHFDALTAGIEYLAADGSVAVTLPHGPFFFARTSNSRCMKTYPVLIRRESLCLDYTAEARSFSLYESWHMLMLVEQAGGRIGTLPISLFDIDDEVMGVWDECSEEMDPLLRMAKQGDYVVVNMANQLAKWRIGNFIEQQSKQVVQVEENIIADNLKDFGGWQGHNGWSYFYRAQPAGQVRADADLAEDDALPLTWNQDEERWICPSKTKNKKKAPQFPFITRTGLHPCIGKHKGCCVDGSANSVVLRWTSHKYIERVKARLHLQLVDTCGDGIDAQVRAGLDLKRRGKGTLAQVDVVRLDRGRNKSNGRLRNRVQRTYEIGTVWPGDVIEVQVDPRDNVHCDTLRAQVGFGAGIRFGGCGRLLTLAPRSLSSSARASPRPSGRRRKINLLSYVCALHTRSC
ncbi:hypothetical protein DFJ74DRAFT_668915 [Hyaloraphidium curvatum]|nr:hypothetical protein DFJ74DRAFT_668915 [Hyaloraphidium curvatum]